MTASQRDRVLKVMRDLRLPMNHAVCNTQLFLKVPPCSAVTTIPFLLVSLCHTMVMLQSSQTKTCTSDVLVRCVSLCSPVYRWS